MFIKRPDNYAYPAPDKARSGELLTQYASEHKREGLRGHTQMDLQQIANACNVGQPTASNWVNGKTTLLAKHIPFIKEQLGLENSQAQELLEANVNLRPLNTSWLIAQPPHERAGLLIKMMCERSGKTHDEIANAAFPDRNSANHYLSNMTSGRHVLEADDIKKLASVLRGADIPRALQPSTQEVALLKAQAERSNKAIIARNQAIREEYAAHLEAAKHDAPEPFKADTDKVFRYVKQTLAAIGNHSGTPCREADLCRAMGITPQAYTGWKKASIPIAQMRNMASALSELDPRLTSNSERQAASQNHLNFIQKHQIDQRALHKSWLKHQPLELQGGLLLRALREHTGKAATQIAQHIGSQHPNLISNWEWTNNPNSLPKPVGREFMWHEDGSFPYAEALGITSEAEMHYLHDTVTYSSDRLRELQSQALAFAKSSAQLGSTARIKHEPSITQQKTR